MNPPHLVFELGRSIVGNSGILVAKVLYLKNTMESNGKNFAVVDAAMNDLIRPTLYNAHHEVVPVTSNKKLAVIYGKLLVQSASRGIGLQRIEN